MRFRKTNTCRKGAVMVENAIVLMLLLMFILGTIVGGLGVLRYQQIALLAREGALTPACAAQYQSGRQGNAATPTDVFDNAIRPLATGSSIKKA